MEFLRDIKAFESYKFLPDNVVQRHSAITHHHLPLTYILDGFSIVGDNNVGLANLSNIRFLTLRFETIQRVAEASYWSWISGQL